MASSDTPKPVARVRVWDLPVRLFHWAMVMLMVVSWVAADQGFMRVHLWSGSTLLALLLFRIAWGIFGSTTARFSDFVRSPRAVIGYLRAIRGEEPPRHAGHNPAGGWMVVALLSTLCAQVATGLFANDGLGFMGPLALLVTADTSDRLTSLHGWLFNILLVLVYLHIVAVFFYLLVKRDNLITPMITGNKARHLLPDGLTLQTQRVWLALVLLLASAGAAYWLIKTAT